MEKVRDWCDFQALDFRSEINLRTPEYVLAVLVLAVLVVRVVVIVVVVAVIL